MTHARIEILHQPQWIELRNQYLVDLANERSELELAAPEATQALIQFRTEVNDLCLFELDHQLKQLGPVSLAAIDIGAGQVPGWALQRPGGLVAVSSGELARSLLKREDRINPRWPALLEQLLTGSDPAEVAAELLRQELNQVWRSAAMAWSNTLPDEATNEEREAAFLSAYEHLQRHS